MFSDPLLALQYGLMSLKDLTVSEKKLLDLAGQWLASFIYQPISFKRRWLSFEAYLSNPSLFFKKKESSGPGLPLIYLYSIHHEWHRFLRSSPIYAGSRSAALPDGLGSEYIKLIKESKLQNTARLENSALSKKLFQNSATRTSW